MKIKTIRPDNELRYVRIWDGLSQGIEPLIDQKFVRKGDSGEIGIHSTFRACRRNA
jgi:hypothetical protein